MLRSEQHLDPLFGKHIRGSGYGPKSFGSGPTLALGNIPYKILFCRLLNKFFLHVGTRNFMYVLFKTHIGQFCLNLWQAALGLYGGTYP